ncbi:hypothetical protein RUND412_008406 [Rhizina undulata]
MSKALISLPSSHTKWQEQLFMLLEKVSMTPEEFESYWLLVDSVYSRCSQYTNPSGTKTIEYYECRLKKSRQSPTRRDTPGIKRRFSSAYIAGLCDVEICVTHHHHDPKHVVERKDASVHHAHDLDASFQRKLPSVIRDII